jgi:pantothenate kinase
VQDLIGIARRMAGSDTRAVLGICGPPGVGKSRLADQLAAGIGPEAVVVPLDGFHLHDDELARLGRLDRKGAPDTFDVDGYVSLLRRVRFEPSTTIYAPAFDRDRELSLAGVIPVLASHRLVITEGNYLLHDGPGWRHVRGQLTECWFLHGDEARRRERLVERHVRHGRTPDDATEWTTRVDEPNAELIDGSRHRADLAVDVDSIHW